MPSFPIQSSNVTIANSATIATNPYKTVTQAQAHGEQRPAVLRVMSYNVQNQGSNPIQATWTDSSGANIAGPFVIPASPGNWTERASAPAFLFETTRTNSTPFLGYDLTITLNAASACQVFVEYTTSFVPGRVGA